MRIEQGGGLAAMQALRTAPTRSSRRETKFKAAALAILGARAAERYDARRRAPTTSARSRRRARRSGCSCGAWPTRRSRSPSAAPATSRTPSRASARRRRATASCCMLRFMGLVAPPPGSSVLLRVRGFLADPRARDRAAGDRPRARRAGLAAVRRRLARWRDLLLGIVDRSPCLGVLALLGRRRQARARERRVAAPAARRRHVRSLHARVARRRRSCARASRSASRSDRAALQRRARRRRAGGRDARGRAAGRAAALGPRAAVGGGSRESASR